MAFPVQDVPLGLEPYRRFPSPPHEGIRWFHDWSGFTNPSLASPEFSVGQWPVITGRDLVCDGVGVRPGPLSSAMFVYHPMDTALAVADTYGDGVRFGDLHPSPDWCAVYFTFDLSATDLTYYYVNCIDPISAPVVGGNLLTIEAPSYAVEYRDPTPGDAYASYHGQAIFRNTSLVPGDRYLGAPDDPFSDYLFKPSQLGSITFEMYVQGHSVGGSNSSSRMIVVPFVEIAGPAPSGGWHRGHNVGLVVPGQAGGGVRRHARRVVGGEAVTSAVTPGAPAGPVPRPASVATTNSAGGIVRP